MSVVFKKSEDYSHIGQSFVVAAAVYLFDF